MLQKIKALAKQYATENISVRQHLHANPELSYQEYNTCLFVQQTLSKLQIPYTVMATTGVVGIIEGNNPSSRIVALRADLDALPIQEENNIPYKSTVSGVMHACGHDVHTATLLGAAKILQQTKDEWEGTVKLIFQPGEEKNPGGASYMIRDGALENPRPQAIYAMHVHPGLDVGKVSFRPGMSMASADELYISIFSAGGHAAAPHLTTDTILVASHIIISLQQIISRNNNPTNPSVLSITSVQGGATTNVIPTEVKIMGTLRCMDEVWRKKAHELITKQIHQLAEAMGATAKVHIDIGYPFVNNDETLYHKAKANADTFMGHENVELTELRMGAEDFGYYTHVVPGCFYRVGVRNTAKGIASNVHTPTFNIDEDAIETAVGLMAWMGVNG
jgi:amidohydrolase